MQNSLCIFLVEKMIKQAGAELGQAQVQLGLIRLQISLALPNFSIGLSWVYKTKFYIFLTMEVEYNN